jgi:hypothetical protein
MFYHATLQLEGERILIKLTDGVVWPLILFSSISDLF